MAKIKIKLRPKSRKGVIIVKALITHPMETGLRKNKKSGKNYPANHITDLTVKINGNTIVSGMIGSSVSKNPYFQFRAPGKKGDSVELSFTDNNGKSLSTSVKSK